MADFGSTELDAFRNEARIWLEANFPPSLKGKGAIMNAEEPVPVEGDYGLWKTRMGDKGWGVPTWPTEYGGGGLTASETRVLQAEMNRIGAWNPIGGMGVMMFGPTLLEYGTEEQKRRHVPPIVKGELRWCQGYSEPGSGSDLASLQTKAEDKGDHFLVNGQKIWTSGAQYADWCFCLTRTDPTKKHEGISFLLIDMTSPGVEVRPILLINGTSPFCETFFTDVKVPKDQLFGPLNGGWTIAKRLLQHERQGISGANGGPGPGAVPGPPLKELAKAYVGVEADGRLRVDFRLWDVAQETQLLGLQFTSTPENWRRVAHKISDAVYERLTGEKGYFDTRIVFVAESGPKLTRVKRLAIMDQDGANPSYLTDGSYLVMTPRFSSTSQQITYMALRPTGSAVYLFNIETGRQETLGAFPGMVSATSRKLHQSAQLCWCSPSRSTQAMWSGTPSSAAFR